MPDTASSHLLLLILRVCVCFRLFLLLLPLSIIKFWSVRLQLLHEAGVDIQPLEVTARGEGPGGAPEACWDLELVQGVERVGGPLSLTANEL